MARWLLAEGYRLRAAQDHLVDTAVAIANKQLDEIEVAGWLQKHSRRNRSQVLRSQRIST